VEAVLSKVMFITNSNSGKLRICRVKAHTSSEALTCGNLMNLLPCGRKGRLIGVQCRSSKERFLSLSEPLKPTVLLLNTCSFSYNVDSTV
jgi:hypothetical protein